MIIRRPRSHGGVRPVEHTFEATAGADGVRKARVEAQAWMRAHADAELANAGAIVVAELLANAHQHGAPPVHIRLTSGPAALRVAVGDASPRWPVLAASSAENMTGRGLALVDALSANWGVERAGEVGKTVWCELSTEPGIVASPIELETLLAGDADQPLAQERYTVVLGDVPTGMLVAAKAHVDNLARELSLAAAAEHAHAMGVPDHLAALMETAVKDFAPAREAIKRQALAAAQRGDARTSLTLHLPLSAADAGEKYLAALDEIDGYARAARLLTLETPPDHRLFRHWYVENVVRQLRGLAHGEPPLMIQPFEDRLLEEVRALSLARRASAQAMRLQRVTAALARARTPEDVAAVVISEAVAALGAYGGGLLVPADDGEHLAVPGTVGYGDTLVGQLRAERLDARLPAATALRTGRAIWLESQADRDTRFPEMRGFEPSTSAMCAVPLVAYGRSIGALRFSFRTTKLFDETEREFVVALAAQTAQTLQRTETYELERKAIVEFQRAMLPQSLPVIAGWDVAAYYNPAGGNEIGGDFYDVIPLEDGRIAAVVGDVMGRGMQAAAAMAEIRSVIRAYAVDNADPARVFERLDAFFAAFDLEQLVTVLYLVVDEDGATVHIANAGHLPPLLVRAGTAEIVAGTGSLPFGAGGDARASRQIRLREGDALVVVTDGLIERHGEDIDVGLRRLVEAAARATWTTPRALVNQIVASAAQRRAHEDDVTVLALRRR